MEGTNAKMEMEMLKLEEIQRSRVSKRKGLKRKASEKPQKREICFQGFRVNTVYARS